MVECLISLIIVAIVAVVILLIIEAVLGAFFNDARIIMLVRALVGLLVLLYGLQCILGLGYLPHYRY